MLSGRPARQVSFRSSVRGVRFIAVRCERIGNGLVRSVRLDIVGVLLSSYVSLTKKWLRFGNIGYNPRLYRLWTFGCGNTAVTAVTKPPLSNLAINQTVVLALRSASGCYCNWGQYPPCRQKPRPYWLKRPADKNPSTGQGHRLGDACLARDARPRGQP